MFRSPQILALSCPIRPLLLGARDLHVPALSEHLCARWHGTTAGTRLSLRGGEVTARGGGGTEGETSSSKETIASHSTLPSSRLLDCEICQLKAIAPQSLIPKAAPSKDSASSKARLSGGWLASPPGKSVVDLAQNPKDPSTYHDRSNDTKCLQPKRRPWNAGQPSLSTTIKTLSNTDHSHVSHRAPCPRSFTSVHGLWSSNDIRGTPGPPPGLYAAQIRALHRAAAPREAPVLRDCLSPENEERCRRRLGPNLKLYDGDAKGRRGPTQGTGPGRWASVLVSLCSMEGEPAFLFTLRSSALKGRHKGDVCFAGGKSDPADADVVSTALREAREELGVTVATESVWGVLKPLRDMSGMMIAPVLANLGPLEALSFKPNPGEVEEIFTLSLSHVSDPRNRGYTHFRTGDKYGYTLPVFCNGKHRVWGLTAVALDHTLRLVTPP